MRSSHEHLLKKEKRMKETNGIRFLKMPFYGTCVGFKK
jgi:hypothetical protein